MTRRRQITETAALARCTRKVADSADGRAWHGALRECRNALTRAGVADGMAISMAAAAYSVGDAIATTIERDAERRLRECLA